MPPLRWYRPASAGGAHRNRAARSPQVEVQRAYRARLKAAGKVVRLVDANPPSRACLVAQSAPAAPAPATLAPQAIPAYDPDTHVICEQRAVFQQLRYEFDTALSEIKRLKAEIQQLQLRNGYRNCSPG